MAKGTIVARSIENMRPKEMSLKMECVEEPLTPSQEAARKRMKDECNKVKKMLESLVKEHNGTLICQAGTVSAYQYQLPSSAPPTAAVVKPNTQAQVIGVNQSAVAGNQTIKLNMLNNTATTQGNMQLVIDPRMGVILGTVAPQQGIVSAPVSLMTSITNTTSTTMSTMTTTSPVVAPITPVPQQTTNDQYKTTRSGRKNKQPQIPVQQAEIIEETPPPPPPSTPIIKRAKPSQTTHVVLPTSSTPTQPAINFRVKTVAKQTVIQRPHEANSIGGLMIGNKAAAGEIIDESKKNQLDGREITFSKMNGGRTYPSLVVVARPNLKTKNVTSQAAQKERSELDIKVKGVLMYQSNKFTEWLLQQGLVRSEHFCDKHPTNSLKLGQYTDAAQNFNYSGGYVWITACCPERFVSVFCGSIFQGAPHSPTVLLKLIYHWSCQTNVQNVISWVKVTNYYVKTFYAYLRSICTAAIAEKCKKMGGKNSMIQVGVISLGTTSPDGNLRQVKAEVLGILDPETMELRLRASKPVNEIDRSIRRKFTSILHPLTEWVHKDSKILTDFTVDKATLREMGFHNISQSAFGDQNPRSIASNYHIMEYLRQIVPRMFQNTLSLLSRQMIQQFLDELVWREMFGGTALRAFENILTHINEQTQLNSDTPLLDRLAKIAANPSADWSYKNLRSEVVSRSTAPTSPPMVSIGGGNPVLSGQFQAPMVTIPKETAIQSAIEMDTSMPRPATNKRANRKRPYSTVNPDATTEHTVTPEPRVATNGKTDQVPLHEFYYGTMQPEKSDKPGKENKILFNFKCFLCSATMHSNTEIMEHMVSHVPPQVPGQTDPPVCRYCCTAFSSKHQMSVHVTEAHSNFGKSDSDMLVCAICEQKFGTSGLLINHMSSTHYPSEMPYRCDTCGYRTSSHKDVIDHYYSTHNKSDSVQCPYCLKIVNFVKNGQPQASSVYAYLLHMQRHIVRREEKLNKCPRCCLWFNQMSSLKAHVELHSQAVGPKVVPYNTSESTITVARFRNCVNRYVYDDFAHEIMPTERVKKWYTGPIKVNAPKGCGCQECEEDVDVREHYPGELKCQRCRYITCCWRAFKEHQRQIHNERPLTSVVVPSPLVNIPLECEMQCSCGYKTTDGNHLATHLVKCKKRTAFPAEETRPGMLDSLGLVPRPAVTEDDNSKRRSSISSRGKDDKSKK